MKSINLIYFFLLASFISIAQTKKETEEWIVEQYNEYEDPVNRSRDLFFEDGYIYYLWLIAENHGFWSKLKIKDIKNIKIYHKKYNASDTVGWDVITLYFDKQKLYTRDVNLSVESNYIVSEGTTIDIKLKNNFITDGLKPRMEKALLHLIKQYGGNATTKKDPF